MTPRISGILRRHHHSPISSIFLAILLHLQPCLATMRNHERSHFVHEPGPVPDTGGSRAQ
jgi:hypothetical protein